MFTGPVGPVEVIFYWPEAVFGNFYWPGAIGSPLASSPGKDSIHKHFSENKIVLHHSKIQYSHMEDSYDMFYTKPVIDQQSK